MFNWDERNSRKKLFYLGEWLDQFWIVVVLAEWAHTHVDIQRSVGIEKVMTRKKEMEKIDINLMIYANWKLWVIKMSMVKEKAYEIVKLVTIVI